MLTTEEFSWSNLVHVNVNVECKDGQRTKREHYAPRETSTEQHRSLQRQLTRADTILILMSNIGVSFNHEFCSIKLRKTLVLEPWPTDTLNPYLSRGFPRDSGPELRYSELTERGTQQLPQLPFTPIYLNR